MSAVLEQTLTSIKPSLRLTAHGPEYVLDFGDFSVACPLTFNFPEMLRECADHLELAVRQTPAAYLAIGSRKEDSMERKIDAAPNKLGILGPAGRVM